MLTSPISTTGASQHRTHVQGHDHHQGPQGGQGPSKPNALGPIQTTVNTLQQSSSPTPTLTSPIIAAQNGDYPPTFDIGSPTKTQSPLRQSISYTDAHELEYLSFQDPPSNRQSISSFTAMAFTGDNKKNSPISNRPGSARPARLSRGYSPGSDGVLDDHLDATAVPPRRQRTSSQVSQISTSQLASPASSRFAFLASPMSAFKSFASSPSSAPSDVDFQNDELMYLDIEAALFPSGQPSERDAFSPAAFKNLQMNATGLLQKYQAAYQSRTIHIRELKVDEMTQLDEKGELEMKAHHLKLQLEEMSRKAAEQESIMQSLMEELNREKKLRVEEQFAREKKLMSSECSTVSEDLGVEEDQRTKWRKSGEMSKSDPGSDTDGESIDGSSVFSRSRSPTVAASISESGLAEVSSSQAKPANLGPLRASRPSQPPMTTLQKLFKGVSGESREDASRGVNGCRNCQGQEASMAWDTVSLLRDENKSLKERVTDLETAVEGALDALAGFGIET